MKKLNNTFLKTNVSEESKGKLKYTLRWTETEAQNVNSSISRKFITANVFL